MAYHFHDLSPYVLIGNPLTLSIIEFFAVPGALLGALLYPLGLDAPVWLYVGAGIKFILWIARMIAAAPASTVHLPAFAPFALPFLTLAVCSATIWRTWTFRAMAIPLLGVGLIGASQPHRFDLIIPPTGDLVAVRGADGALSIQGKRFNAFDGEQWLAADGDGREAQGARAAVSACDRLGCVAPLPEGQSVAIVMDRYAFEEDCERANVIVSPLTAPSTCNAPYVFDEAKLGETGAVGLTWRERANRSRGRPRGLARSPVVAGAQSASRGARIEAGREARGRPRTLPTRAKTRLRTRLQIHRPLRELPPRLRQQFHGCRTIDKSSDFSLASRISGTL